MQVVRGDSRQQGFKRRHAPSLEHSLDVLDRRPEREDEPLEDGRENLVVSLRHESVLETGSEQRKQQSASGEPTARAGRVRRRAPSEGGPDASLSAFCPLWRHETRTSEGNIVHGSRTRLEDRESLSARAGVRVSSSPNQVPITTQADRLAALPPLPGQQTAQLLQTSLKTGWVAVQRPLSWQTDPLYG